jgi:hypothetical protein
MAKVQEVSNQPQAPDAAIKKLEGVHETGGKAER